MKWKMWIAGGVFVFAFLILYSCAVAAGRADREMKGHFSELKLGEDDPEDDWDGILAEDYDAD